MRLQRERGIMSNLSPERRLVVVLCAGAGALSGGLVLLKGHRVLLGIWIGLMAVTLVVAMVQLARLKRDGR
jgi:hypothetical protein